MSQQHPRITLEGFTSPGAQITVADLMQLTPMPDGSVAIDLAGSDVEVECSDGSHPNGVWGWDAPGFSRGEG